MLLGYARVSTRDQNLDLQLDALRKAGVDDANIFVEKVSGKLKERPELDRMLAMLRPGDTVVCWKLARLGRSHAHLISLAEQFRERNINMVFLLNGIDTRTAMGRFFFAVMAAFAEMERENIVENTIAGQQAAKARGKHIGRPGGLGPEEVNRARMVQLLRGQGYSFRDIASSMQINVATAHKYAKLELDS